MAKHSSNAPNGSGGPNGHDARKTRSMTATDWMMGPDLFKKEPIDMPEFKKDDDDSMPVQWVRGLSPRERDIWEAERSVDLMQLKDGEMPPLSERNKNFTASLIVRGMVTDTGERMFPETPQIAGHIEKFSNGYPISAMNRLYLAVLRLTFGDTLALARAKGNSNADRSGSASAGSPTS